MQIFARQLNMLGLEVLGVSNGRDAVELTLAALAAGNPFDLVLMDLEMPIIDGYEATRRLRGGGFSGPIVALTAHSTDDNRLECLELGCDDCLCKPIDWNRLGEVIRQFLPDLRGEGSSLDPDDLGLRPGSAGAVAGPRPVHESGLPLRAPRLHVVGRPWRSGCDATGVPRRCRGPWPARLGRRLRLRRQARGSTSGPPLWGAARIRVRTSRINPSRWTTKSGTPRAAPGHIVG